VLSKYDAAPKTLDGMERSSKGDAIWVVSGIKMQIRINTPHRRFRASVDLMPYILTFYCRQWPAPISIADTNFMI
jgi:hypothetical protein